MARFVRDDGSPRARLVLIGEAPGRQEDATGLPFVGWSGQRLAGWWRSVGLQRSDFYITNVCIAEGQRVLMTDLTWKQIEHVKVNDRLLAFDEQGKTRGKQLRKWRVATVTAVASSERACIAIATKDGESLILTPDHRLLVPHRARSASVRWVTAKRVRSCLGRIVQPWIGSRSEDAAYLAGLFDGEGTLALHNAAQAKRHFHAAFTQKLTVVLEEGIKAMERLGFTVGVTTDTKRFTAKAWVKGGVAETIRFLGITRPFRLLQRFAELLEDPPVIRIKPSEIIGKYVVGPRRVYDLTTTTGTMIVEGFAVHNCPYRPPANRLEAIPHAELAPYVDGLHDRIARLHDPWLIVPTGNTALRALTGLSNISKRRGSIYEYVDRNGRSIKVIPTIHPAALAKQPKWERRCIMDWRRIAADALFRELRLPEREHFIKPTFDDCRAYLDDAARRADLLVFDIETPRELIMTPTQLKSGKVKYKKTLGAARVTCIGFAFEPHFSFTIPTTLSYWQDETVLREVWSIIRQLLKLRCEKGGQQAYAFDSFYLAEDHGIEVENFRWDTLALHHAFDPADEHALHYMASIDTREPYWKDEAKDPDEINKWTADVERFWTYNGKDNAVTWELADLYIRRHHERGTLQFYERHYRQMFAPLLALMRHGLALDEATRTRRFARLLANCITIQDRLTELAGEPLYGKKSLSSQKLQRFLYETLRLPQQRDRKTGNLTTKEVTVRRLALRYPAKLGQVEKDVYTSPVASLNGAGPLILRHRRDDMLSKFYADSRVDADGRMRCTFKFTTETWRLASAKNPRRTGTNLQNQDREVRDVFIPDEDCVFLEADMSQIEDRYVRMYTRAPRQIEIARSMPWELDVHKLSACAIFPGLKIADVTKDQRYLGKRAKHAGNYGMRGGKLSDEMLKDGYARTPEECQGYIDSIYRVDYEVPEYHKEVRQLILRDRGLANTWGAVIDFTYDRLDDDLYRRGYAWRPQSDAAMLLNQWGLIPLYEYMQEMMQAESGPWLKVALNNQAHDSVLLSTPPECAWPLACFLKASLERPRVIAGNELTVPVEFKLGATMAGTHEFKKFPGKRNFEEAAYSCLAK